MIKTHLKKFNSKKTNRESHSKWKALKKMRTNHQSLQAEDLTKGEADSQDRNQNIAEWSKNKF